MTQIIRYIKSTDAYTTYTLVTPDTQLDEMYCTELCTLDGVTYVAVPDGVVLPDQPVEIKDSIQVVTLTDALRDAIKTASPHCRLINDRMIEKIRASYSIDDEMYFARIGVGAATGLYQPEADEMQALTTFGEFVESVRQWGRDERAKLGL